MERKRWNERPRLVLPIAVWIAAMCLLACTLLPTPEVIEKAVTQIVKETVKETVIVKETIQIVVTATPEPKETPTATTGVTKGAQVQPTCRVKRETPQVWAGNVSPLPELGNHDWYGLEPGGWVKTDDMGEAKLDIDGCMFIYVFRDSQLIKSGCHPGQSVSGNVSCSIQGTSVYNNSCASAVIIQTPSVELQLQGTWLAVTYLPNLELTLIQVFEGQARVWPVTGLWVRKLVPDSEAIVVTGGSFLFTVPDDKLPEVGIVAGLDARQGHSLDELGSFQEPASFVFELTQRANEPNLARWMDRIRERAEADDKPIPPTFPGGQVDVVTETVVDQGTPQVVEKEITKIIEKVVEVETVVAMGTILRGGGGPLEDPRVQDAVLRAVPWEALIEESFAGQDVPIAAELPDQEIDDARSVTYDPEKAKELLAESGFPEGFELTLFYPPNDEQLRLVMKGMFYNLLEIGIWAEVAEVPASEVQAKMLTSIAAGLPVLSLSRQ